MATSLQERLKLKQYQVDTWTTREQLCLASAVMRSGDQNWVAVRRNIKMLTSESSRPPDWYSTKNCALQYAKLLEQVDTPKRKRERGDGGNETPGEIVTKMLSKQRVEELQALESEERTAYHDLRQEIQQLEAGLLDHQLDSFWEQFVKERTEAEAEERRHQQWLKEREEKITAIQQALKHQGTKVITPPLKKKQKVLQVGGSLPAAGRRGSGLSETSSEVDSAVDSPELPDPTSDSLLGLSSRGIRGLGISSVSEALQNLVSSAISGTDSVSKDKPSNTSPSKGSPTLSILLDLPPCTPGAPLPRINELTAYDRKDQEKTSEGSKSIEQPVKDGCNTDKKKDSVPNQDTTKEEESTKHDTKPMELDTADKRQVEEMQLSEDKKEGGPGEAMKEGNLLELDKSEGKLMQTEESLESKQRTEKVEPQHVKSDPKESPDVETGRVKAEEEEDGDSSDHLEAHKSSIKEAQKQQEEGEEKKSSVDEGRTSSQDQDIKLGEEEDLKHNDPNKDGKKGEMEQEEEVKDGIRKKDDIEEQEETEKKDKEEGEKKTLEDEVKCEGSEEAAEEGEKKGRKGLKRELEEDQQDSQDSKEWSEEEGSIITNTSSKRKVSGGDLLGSSSPLVSESAPNSPASTHYGDDSESERAYKSWKKPIMILWNEIAAHKFASLFLKPITDDQAPGYHSIVYRPLDLQKIKRNMENGTIRTTAEFQRDIMLMFLNATMYNTRDHNVYHMAHRMMKDAVSTIEQFLNTQMLARAEETPQKSLRRETRESSAKRGDEDPKRKREQLDEKSLKKRRL